MANYIVTKGYIGKEDFSLGTSTFSRTTSTGASQTMTQVALGYITISAKTADYAVATSDTGTLFTNTGAAGAVVFTLPTADPGLVYYFNVQVAQTFTITADTSDKIRSTSTLSAAAGSASCSTIGNTLMLVCTAANEWEVMAIGGSWTVA